MVEKIILNLQEVRGLGNIAMGKTVEDFQEYNSAVIKAVDLVNGVLTTVFRSLYNEYEIGFNFNTVTKEVYLSINTSEEIGFGFTDKQFHLSTSISGLSFEFDDDDKRLVMRGV